MYMYVITCPEPAQGEEECQVRVRVYHPDIAVDPVRSYVVKFANQASI